MRTFVLALGLVLLAAPAALGVTTRLHISRDTDGDSYAEWERKGVRYITRDAGVIDAVEKLLARKNALAKEQNTLARERRGAGETRRREIDARVADIERELRELARQRDAKLDALFERAVREGKAKRR